MDDLGKLAVSEQRKQRLVVFGVVGTLILAGSLFQVERALLPNGRGAAAFAAMPQAVRVGAVGGDAPANAGLGEPGRIPVFGSTPATDPAGTAGYDYAPTAGTGGPLPDAGVAAVPTATPDTPVQLASADPSVIAFGGGSPAGEGGGAAGLAGGGGGGGGLTSPGGGGGGGGGATPEDGGTTVPGGGSSTGPGNETTTPPGGGTTVPGDGTTGPGGVTAPPIPGGVPEPATWALMLIGFGAIAATMRRRSSVARGAAA